PLHMLDAKHGHNLITSFSQLQWVLENHAEFSTFALSHTCEDAFNLQRENLNKIFLNAPLYLAANKLQPFLDEASKNHTCLICVGEQEELTDISVHLSKLVHQISLPISLYNLKFLLES